MPSSRSRAPYQCGVWPKIQTEDSLKIRWPAVCRAIQNRSLLCITLCFALLELICFQGLFALSAITAAIPFVQHTVNCGSEHSSEQHWPIPQSPALILTWINKWRRSSSAQLPHCYAWSKGLRVFGKLIRKNINMESIDEYTGPVSLEHILNGPYTEPCPTVTQLS